jgi:hypothetical protein
MVQDRRDSALDRHRLTCAPVVEIRAVAEAEPGEERASGKRGCGGQIGEVPRANRVLELVQVDANLRRIESDLRAVDDEDLATNGRAKCRQRAPERTSGRQVIRIRPEQRRQLCPGEGPSLRGQEQQDGKRLSRIDPERGTVDEDGRRTEQADVEYWSYHDVTVRLR